MMKYFRKSAGKKNLSAKIKAFTLTAIMSIAFSPSVYASNKIMQSELFKAAKDLANDVTTVLLIAVPIVAAICIIFFSMRKGHAVEQHDIEKWQKAITRTIISAIIAFCASGLITILTLYFGGSASA